MKELLIFCSKIFSGINLFVLGKYITPLKKKFGMECSGKFFITLLYKKIKIACR